MDSKHYSHPGALHSDPKTRCTVVQHKKKQVLFYVMFTFEPTQLGNHNITTTCFVMPNRDENAYHDLEPSDDTNIWMATSYPQLSKHGNSPGASAAPLIPIPLDNSSASLANAVFASTVDLKKRPVAVFHAEYTPSAKRFSSLATYV